ncbi:MAG: helix-turn-helix transcriptional regulator [Pseudomonadota bacterium]
MEVKNEVSVDNFRAINRFAAGAGGKKVRSFQNDRWLISTGPSAYRSIYDPSLGRIVSSWREVRPHLIMFYGEARPNTALSFPVRASSDLAGAFIGTNSGIQSSKVAQELSDDPNHPHLLSAKLSAGSEAHLTISSRAPAYFFGVFGFEEALKDEFSVIKTLSAFARESAPSESGVAAKATPVEQEALNIILQMLRNPFEGEALDAYLVGKSLELLSLSTHSVQQAEVIRRAKSKKSPVSFVCRELKRTPEEELVLGDFARYLDMSERTLSRLFRAQTGKTFSAYQRERRMELAARLLAMTPKSTTQIAANVGYKAVTAFFRAFREHHGMTPNQYRSTHLN